MAVRIDGSTDYVGRSASLPDPAAVTMAGWADMVVDRANFSSVCCLTASPRTAGQLCLQTASDGNTFNLWYDSGSISVQEPSTGYAAAVGVPFFWALVVEGTGSNQVKAYFRTRGSNTFSTSFTATTGLGATYTPVLMRFGNADTAELWNGRIWNIKVWERALTSKELLVESFYSRVMYPASLHLHYLLANASDDRDYSGNGRTATLNGALTTEAASGNYGLWTPRRKILAPTVATAGRTVNATTQALTITGQAASVARARAVNATTQALSLTGQAATVGKARQVNATTQALTLTAQPAAISRARSVQGTTQALTITGQPATVLKGGARTVNATVGVLTFIGQPATVTRGTPAAPALPGGGFKMFRRPVFNRRLEQIEDVIEDIEQAAADLGESAPAVNELRRRAQELAAEARAELQAREQRARDEAELSRRVGEAEEAALEALSGLLQRIAKRQKPRVSRGS